MNAVIPILLDNSFLYGFFLKIKYTNHKIWIISSVSKGFIDSIQLFRNNNNDITEMKRIMLEIRVMPTLNSLFLKIWNLDVK